MRFHAMRSVLLCAPLAALALLTACAGTGDGTTTRPSVPTTTTTYVGTFGDGAQTGTISLSIATTSSSSGSSTVATGTLVTVDGTTVQLTGTFDSATGALLVSGSGYSVTGTLSNGLLAGKFTATHGTGIFSAQPSSSSSAAPKIYCGTYAAPGDFGWFNIVISSSGTISGFTVPFGSTNNGVSLTGTRSGSTITLTSSEGVSAPGTLSTDGVSVSGSFTPRSGGLGTYNGSVNGCGASSGGTVTPNVIAGSWSTQGAQTTLRVQLLPVGSSLSGAGTITVPPITPTTGPPTPAYTGDNFTVTSGTFTSPNVTFTATLGANPTGTGGYYYGTLSFTGTVSGGTMSGTLTFTPPRTASQIFAAQTVTAATLTKQ